MKRKKRTSSANVIILKTTCSRRYCIILLILIDKKYMNKVEVYKLVDDVLKIDTYKMFMEESLIILQNMSYVNLSKLSTGILDVEKTRNKPINFTPLMNRRIVIGVTVRM